MVIRYSPGLPPDFRNATEGLEYVLRELRQIGAIVNQVIEGHFEIQYAEPAKREAGDVRYADGTSWDPGAGEGLYLYTQGNVWTKL